MNIRNLIEALNLDEYQEHQGGTYSHDGVEYDLNKTLAVTAERPIYDIPITELDWIFEFSDPLATSGDKSRVDASDITAPVLLTVWEGQLTVLDGLHRIEHAREQHVRGVPAQFVANCRLGEFRNDGDTGQHCEDSDYGLYQQINGKSLSWHFISEEESHNLRGKIRKIHPRKENLDEWDHF